jgi:dihydrolipoamide dehydrogenase
MTYDIAIIGAGPGGYVAAIRAAQLGAKVALIEKDNLGGTCLNWGCIPSKATITCADKYNSAKKLSKFGITIENLSFDFQKISERKWFVVEKMRKSLTQLIKANKIDVIYGEACIETPNNIKVIKNSEEIYVEFKNLIIAAGSRPISLPGLEIDHEFILDTNDVIKLVKIPESVLVVGTGPSGVEWTRIFEIFGSKVVLVELAPTLVPMCDKSISERLERIFKIKKLECHTSTKIKEIIDKKVILNNEKEIYPEIIFVAAGRTPNTDIKGIENLNLSMNSRYIRVDNNLKTNVDNIYAIGDVTGLVPLAHTASHQGLAAVENILLNKQANINYEAIPSIVYGNPELCGVGLNEQELIRKKIDYKVSTFPVSAAGKFFIEDELEGFVKVLASPDSENILGVHIIADHGSDLIQQAAIAINNGLTVKQLQETIFAHPTYSEALYEAFLGIDDRALHLPPK